MGNFKSRSRKRGRLATTEPQAKVEISGPTSGRHAVPIQQSCAQPSPSRAPENGGTSDPMQSNQRQSSSETDDMRQTDGALICVALYDYDARTSADLTFKIGIFNGH